MPPSSAIFLTLADVRYDRLPLQKCILSYLHGPVKNLDAITRQIDGIVDIVDDEFTAEKLKRKSKQ